jgi:hypothetical protein
MRPLAFEVEAGFVIDAIWPKTTSPAAADPHQEARLAATHIELSHFGIDLGM